MQMLSAIKRLFAEEKGQGLAEYGLILALVALAAVGTLTALGGGLSSIFDRINTQLDGAAPGTTTAE